MKVPAPRHRDPARGVEQGFLVELFDCHGMAPGVVLAFVIHPCALGAENTQPKN